MKRKNRRLYSFIGLAIIPTILALATPDVSQLPQGTRASQSAPAFQDTEGSVNFTIEIPKLNWQYAPGRDFYVLGDIEGAVPNGTKVSVSLYRDSDSQRVRHVFTTKKADKAGMYIDYPLITFNTSDRDEIRDSQMPDLVYDPADVNTFKDQWRKLYYDDYNFSAVINGGAYTHDVNPNDENGNPYEYLTAGAYTVVVAAESTSGTLLGSTSFPVTIGVNPEKLMSRFQPAEHQQNVLAEAAEKNLTIYDDPFPGLFNQNQFIVNYPNRALIPRINLKWKFQDLIEYREGRVHFYIYNVAVTSTTWSVELATIMDTKDVDNPDRLVCYFYDVGDLQVGGRKGKFVGFDQDKRLHLYRMDYQEAGSRDNYVDTATLPNVVSDFDFSDGVSVTAGDRVAFYGVLKPIQPDPADLVLLPDENYYEINNRITKVAYHITGDGVDYTTRRDVDLVRLTDGSEVASLLEFKHDFDIEAAWAGKELTVSMQAFDAHGAAVEGTGESFKMVVAAAGQQRRAA